MRGASAIVGMLMVVIVGGIAGCGGSSGSAAVALTKWLPPGADFYSAADLVSLREDLDLPEDADPLPTPEPLDDPRASADFVELARLALADLVEPSSDPRVTAALDLGAARTIAASSDRSGFAVTLVSTSADTGDIGSTLGDLGFTDDGGILSKGSAGPSFRLEDGLIIVARDPALLRAVPEEAADDVPDPLLEDVDGSLITTSPGLEDCTEGFAASADADGTGSVAIRVDGEADPERLTLQEQAGISFGDPEADGDLLTVPVSSTDAAPAAVRALQLLLVGYECP